MNSLVREATAQVRNLRCPEGIKYGIYCEDRREFVYGISESTRREAFERLKERLNTENPAHNFVAREVIL